MDLSIKIRRMKCLMRKLLTCIARNKNGLTAVKSLAEYSSPDTALAKYIQYYSTLEEPGYAVLVTGSWGVGKTYQVKQVISERERYFVSLYGLGDVNAIHDAVLASCLPSLNVGEYMSTFSEVGKAMGEKYALAGFASSAWSVFLRQRLKPDRTIIFDDLERSSLWTTQKSELLGAINHYVEHRGFRVVVICHDERIADELDEVKEKIFGHTVKVEPQKGMAFEAFLEDIRDESAKDFVIRSRSTIEGIFAQSGQESLRIFKHLINDISRLHSILEVRHLDNKELIDHILRFFCALDIEVRAGNLNDDLLVNRRETYYREGFNRDDPGGRKVIREITYRYASSDIIGNIICDEIVKEMLVEGLFDAERMAYWLDKSPYFIQALDEEPWRIVINFDELDDATLREGISRMQSQFDERSVTNMGEFLHIAALRLMMAEQNSSGQTMEEEVALCLTYVDDILYQGKMPPRSLECVVADRLFEAYGGYSYWVSDTTRPHFRTICDHVDTARQLALEATYSMHAEEILRQLKEDQSSIIRTISPTNSGHSIFANIPILVHIPVKLFLDAWLGGPRGGWRKTTMALDNRYCHGGLDKHLFEERSWLIELEKEMELRINSEEGLDAFRLKRVRPKIFDEVKIQGI